MMSSGTRINSTDSSIKIAIDTWYENNLKTDYGKYLSTTAIYCNDRTEKTAGTYNANGTNFDFAPRYRAYSSFSPTYDCTEASDAFSVDNEKAKLQYPVALMTSDEIMYAGGRVNSIDKSVVDGNYSFKNMARGILLQRCESAMVADNFVSENVINGIELNIRSNHSSVQGNVCGSNKKSGLRIAGSKGISVDGNSFRGNRGYAAEFIRSHISSYKGNRFEENGYSNRIRVRNSKIPKK